MERFIITAGIFSILFHSVAVADENSGFVVDISDNELREMYNYRIYSDLEIGEQVSVHSVYPCWLNKNGLLAVAGRANVRIKTRDNPIRVTRISEDSIRIDNWPNVNPITMDQWAKDQMYFNFNAEPCQSDRATEMAPVEHLIVQSINGVTSLSELLASANE